MSGAINMNVMGAYVATSSVAKEGSKKMMYYPAYKNAKGEDKNARITIPVLINIRNQEKPSNMQITAWGKMADVCAKALSPGREVSFVVEPRQYETVYKTKGVPVEINGQTLKLTGYSYNVKSINFGSESASFIALDISKGIRKADWFKPGHPDADALKARRKEINSMVYTPGSAEFCYATVGGAKPQNQAPVNPPQYVPPVNPAPVEQPAVRVNAAGEPVYTAEQVSAMMAGLAKTSVQAAVQQPVVPVQEEVVQQPAAQVNTVAQPLRF